VTEPFTENIIDPVDGGIGGFQEEIHTCREQKRIQDARDDDPFPQFVLGNEMMGLNVGLEGYYNFLEQNEGLFCLLCSNLKYLFGWQPLKNWIILSTTGLMW
jgi:hypothetical protein